MPTVSESRIIAASRERIWAVLADIENASRWNGAWHRIELLSEQRQGAGTTFRAHAEDGATFDFHIAHWAPPEYIAFAPVPQGDTGHYLLRLESQAFLLQPVDEGRTHVELIASAASRGLRGWILGRLFWPGYQKQGLRLALDRLQALFEPPEETGSGPPEPRHDG